MKENIEIPAAGLEPRGEITIEIFDDKTGELVRREKKKNFVHDSILRSMANMMMRQTFLLSGSSRYYNTYPSAILDSIVLTDYAGAPNPAQEVYRQGNVVAYGTKNVAAGNLKRGAWNANESIMRSDYLKLVFDFATSQGNGTFQSIYTHKTASDNETYLYPTMYDTVLLPFTYDVLGEDAGKLYFMKPTKVYVVEALDFAVDHNGFLNCDYQEIDLSKLNLTYAYGLAIANNNLYISAPNYGASSKIWKVSLSNPETYTEIETGVPSVYYTAYDRANDRFIVGDSMNAKHHVFDRNWTKLEVVDTPGFNGIMRVSKDGKFWLGAESHYERATGLVTRVGNNNDYMYFTPLGDYAICRASGTDNKGVRFGARSLFFSRSLLDSPVTKTAQQNMKITYEFNIPKLNLFL